MRISTLIFKRQNKVRNLYAALVAAVRTRTESHKREPVRKGMNARKRQSERMRFRRKGVASA